MRKIAKYLIIILVMLLVGSAVLWNTLPHWLPVVAKNWLPQGLEIQTSAIKWLGRGISVPEFSVSVGKCRLADSKSTSAYYRDGRWSLVADKVVVQTECLNHLPKSADNTPLDLAQLQQQLPKFSLAIGELVITPWQLYAGKLQAENDGNEQQISYKSELLTVAAQLDKQQLKVKTVEFKTPDGQNSLNLDGALVIPTRLDAMPKTGEINGALQSYSYPQQLLVKLGWQGNKGTLTLKEEGDNEPLAVLPWSVTKNTLSIESGKWRWVHEAQPLSGGISLSLSNWSKGFDETELKARLNVITSGQTGKGNVVLSVGPGKVGLINSDIPFQLTGQANLSNITMTASIPGTMTGTALNPMLSIKSGALLRAYGKVSSDITLNEARLPLAGVTVMATGVTGRLQAIMRVTDTYWGQFKMHLDGQAKAFWPDSGEWQWKYWGNGELPTLKAKWDVAGHGKWQDTVFTVKSLSTGLDQISYGLVSVASPRVTLKSPLVWQRDLAKPSFNTQIQLDSKEISFSDAGKLPPSLLNLTLKGEDPAHFQWDGFLRAEDIGPIKLSGRWDGERLRGQGWWPKQSLTVFQPLLPDDLGFKIRGGTLYAQMAFSAAQKQGFEAGGHWVVNDGAMWLKDGELSGLDFIASVRLKDHIWQLGPKGPITLRIKSLTNLFQMNNISADLQGSYPYDNRLPLRLTNMAVDLLKGHISMQELRLPQQNAAVLKLEKISLSELFTLLKPKQFAMSGLVDGELPLYLNDPHWLIKDGWVSNHDSLTLRLDKDMADALINDSMAAGAAIEWLRYLEISRSYAKVNLDNLGVLMMDAEIKGVNSQKSAERAINLNYHHEENIFQLWRSLRFGDNLQEWLQQAVSLPEEGKK